MSDDYLCFAGQDWWTHGRAHSDFQLMTNVARQGHQVLVINSLGMRMPMPGKSTSPLKRIIRKAKSTAKAFQRPLEDVPNFGLLSPIVVPAYGNEKARNANAMSVAAQVKGAMKHHKVSNPVCVVTVPTAIDVVERIPHKDLIYYRADAHSDAEDVDRDLIMGFEDRLFEQASKIIYCAQALMDAEADRHKGKGVLIDHGVDSQLFRPDPKASLPPDIAKIDSPRVGYFGTIEGMGMDLGLVEKVAREHPELNVVLIGRVAIDVTSLEALPNVHMLGWKPYEEIPSYARGFDVALLPRPISEWGLGSNPIKLKEYLSAGLPVVATPVPRAEEYEPYLTIAEDPDAFVSAVAATARSGGVGTPEERRKLVEPQTWAAKALELVALSAD